VRTVPIGRIAAAGCATLASVFFLGWGATSLAESPTTGGPSPQSHDLPYSSFLSEPVLARLQEWNDFWQGRAGFWKEKSKEQLSQACGQISSSTDSAKIAETRRCRARILYSTPIYQDIRSRYRVTITPQVIGGIPTEVFVPEEGVAAKNAQRVLINLHGGAFKDGSGTISHLESIPIASVARIKIVSVDYRMAPKYAFPAASEDVEAVYRELLKQYDAKNIGIFGCSAGGLLTAQSVAWLQSKRLPMPGAVGMFCAGGSYWSEGDSGNFATMWEERPRTLNDDPSFEYLRKVDRNDPLAYPVRSIEVMSRFPPSLLIASTRDLALSSVVYTHSILIQQRVPAELYVWEGLPHSFFVDPQLPQSREMYEVTAGFFDRYLGKPAVQASVDRRQHR